MDVTQFAEAFARVAKEVDQTKAVGSRNAATLITQPGGIFALAGMERVVISAHLSPQGLASYLPVYPSDVDDPRYGILTGFSDTSGAEPAQPCDDAPKGYMKGGTLTAAWGRVARQTQTIEIDTLLHETRGATRNLQLLNNGFDDTYTGIGKDQNFLSNVVQSEMVGVGVQLERKLARMTWTGTPAASNAGGGYKEFPGLDAQIATGQKDAETGALMTAADSVIVNFGDALDSTTKDIVDSISGVENYLYNYADRVGLSPVTWAIVMRPELWFELSAIWPCRYLTDRCGNAAGTGVITINDDGNVRMRDEMRSGSYLLVNGRRYTVITDDGIAETGSAGSYTSSIYFVPLRARGSFPVTYFETIDYRRVAPLMSALGQGQNSVPFWTENGRVLWVASWNKWCFDLQAKIEPRVILRAPQLAAKIQGITYSPFMHYASPFPDSPYFRDGGVSLRTVPAGGQAVWR